MIRLSDDDFLFAAHRADSFLVIVEILTLYWHELCLQLVLELILLLHLGIALVAGGGQPVRKLQGEGVGVVTRLDALVLDVSHVLFVVEDQLCVVGVHTAALIPSVHHVPGIFEAFKDDF